MLMPCVSGEYPRSEGREDPAQLPSSWVLLIDDDPVAARSLARWMRRTSGIAVHAVHSIAEAEVVLEASTEPTAIVTDFEMRGEDGVDALLRARELGCNAPAAILTGAPEAALQALTRSSLDEVIPVFSKRDSGAYLSDWLDRLRLCWAQSA
jgi:DNA-binding NtrC family response regulator